MKWKLSNLVNSSDKLSIYDNVCQGGFYLVCKHVHICIYNNNINKTKKEPRLSQELSPYLAQPNGTHVIAEHMRSRVMQK